MTHFHLIGKNATKSYFDVFAADEYIVGGICLKPVKYRLILPNRCELDLSQPEPIKEVRMNLFSLPNTENDAVKFLQDRSTARHHLESYLAEFMVRQLMADEDPFDPMIAKIAAVHPPE